MRIILTVIFSFFLLNASANDSIQVWLEQFNKSFSAQQFSDADLYLGKVVNQCEKENIEIDRDYTLILYYKFMLSCINEKYEEADKLLGKIEDNWDLLGVSKESTIYSTFLRYKADVLENKGVKTDSIINILLESLAINQKINNGSSEEDIPCLTDIANFYWQNGDYLSALKYREESVSLSRGHITSDDINLAINLSLFSENYSVVGEYEKALKVALEASSILKNKQDRMLYARSLVQVARCYSDLCDFDKALNIGINAIKICGEDSINTVLQFSHHTVANIYLNKGDYSKALEFADKALEMAERMGDNNTHSYIQTLESLGVLYNNLADFEKAIAIQKKIILLHQKLNGTSHFDYARAIANLSSTYLAIGETNQALELMKKALSIRDSIKDHVGCIYSLRSLAQIYDELGHYQEAIKYCRDAKNMCKIVIGENHPEYARCLSALSGIYTSCGNFERAIDNEKEALNIISVYLGKKHPEYAISLDNLATLYYYLKMYDMSRFYREQAISIIESVYGSNHPTYAISLGNYAELMACTGNIEEAISYREKAMSINRQYYGEQSIKYALDLGNMANYLSLHGKNEQAIDFYLKALNNVQNIAGEHNPYYIQTLDNLSMSLASQAKYQEALIYGNEAILIRSKEASRVLSDLTTEGREKYWNTIKDKYNVFYPRLYYNSNNQDCSKLYNAVLFSKGLLLNSNIELAQLVIESNDSSIIRNYYKLRNDKILINKIYEGGGFEKVLVDSLYKDIEALEESIISTIKKYGDFTNRLNIKWTEIQNHLNKDEIAIEFLRIPLANDSIVYAALAVRTDSDFPHLIRLFNESQIKMISDTLSYYCKEMSELIWKPLQSELQGIKNIYFSPSGVLHKIGIEYLPEMGNYNIYRLSSTRELVTKNKEKNGNNAVLYGGLDYYAKTDSTNTTKSIARINETFKERANVRGMGLRGSKEPLAHTQVEVDTIGNYLEKANWTCLLDTASLGTEESFKALSGKGISNLHIATHGFYYTLDEATTQNYDFLLLNNHLASAEDKSLTRSGLLMSGANHILEGDSIPDDVEDGILTAKEIADLDLRGLDLVVLSACQTGLGDISQGEGVFGLQRGFKKAGANTILMSLWEVDDTATQILMTQFYKNYLSGQSKRESLLSAQKYLREYDNGKYNNPKYWAAFIMLDGLN